MIDMSRLIRKPERETASTTLYSFALVRCWDLVSVAIGSVSVTRTVVASGFSCPVSELMVGVLFMLFR
jgi:hypothetical protein